MDLDFTSEPFTVQSRPDKGFRHFCWSSGFKLHQIVLFNDVRHLLLLLLPFVRLLLQIGNLFANAVEPMVVRGTEYNGANKRCIGVFKRLEMYESLHMPF